MRLTPGVNTLIEHLAGACSKHRVQEKWLIAPSLRVGHQWLDQVVRAGTPIVNAHVLTVQSLAIQVIGPRLADGRVAVASWAARRVPRPPRRSAPRRRGTVSG